MNQDRMQFLVTDLWRDSKRSLHIALSEAYIAVIKGGTGEESSEECGRADCYHTRPQVADSGMASRYRG